MMLLIRKSQMNLFDAPKHEESRTVHAGTRHLQNGAVVQVAEHQRHMKIKYKSERSAGGHVSHAIYANGQKIGSIDHALDDNGRNDGWIADFDEYKHKPARKIFNRSLTIAKKQVEDHLSTVNIPTTPDPRVAQADQEYAEWQASQVPEPAPAPPKPAATPKNPKTGPQRVAVLRTINMPGLQEFIADVDAATTKKELKVLDNSKYERIPDLRGSTIKIGDLEIFWTVADLVNGKERDINKQAKAIEDARKAAVRAGRETVTRERTEQAASFRGNNPELAAAIEEQKPALAETYRTSLDSVLARLVSKYGPKLKGTANTGDYSRMQSLRSVLTRDENGYHIDPDKATEEANKYADAVAQEWLHKISGKMAEMESAEVHRMTGIEFSISGTVKGKKVHIIQDMIVNRSVYGLPFNQFPARIYVEGQFMPELAYKKMLEEPVAKSLPLTHLLRKSHKDHVAYDRTNASGVLSHIKEHGISHTHRLEMKADAVGEPGKERIFVTGHLKDHEDLNWLEKLDVGKPMVEMTIDRIGPDKWLMNRTDAIGHKGYGKEARQAAMDYLTEHHGAKTFRTYIEHSNVDAKRMVKDWKRVEDTPHGAYYEKNVGGQPTLDQEVEAFENVLWACKLNQLDPTKPAKVMDQTPEILRKLGVENREIDIDHSDIEKIIHSFVVSGGKHGIPIETAKNIPAWITDPMMVFQSEMRSDSLIVVTEAEHNKQPIYVMIQLEKRRGRHHVVNRVSSTHDRPDTDVERWTKAGLLRCFDNKKGSAWLRSRGLQLPGDGTSLQSLTPDHTVLFKSRHVKRTILKFTGTALWRGRQPSQSDSGNQQPLSMTQKDHTVVMAKSLNHPTSTSGQSASSETNIPNSKNEINKSLAGCFLIKSGVKRSLHLDGIIDMKRTDNIGRKRLQLKGTSLNDMNQRINGGDLNNLDSHNIPQKSELPYGCIKPQPQNDIRKSIQHLPMLIKSRQLHGRIDFNGLQISIETGRSRSREWYNPHDGIQGDYMRR